MKKFIEEANFYLEKNHLNKFPYGISAPIIAQFAYSVISNNLNLSKEDLKLQAKHPLQNFFSLLHSHLLFSISFFIYYMF